MNRRSFAKRVSGVAAALGLGGAVKASEPASFPTVPIELIPIDAWLGMEVHGRRGADGGMSCIQTIVLPDGTIEKRMSPHYFYHVNRDGKDYVVDFGKFLGLSRTI